MPRSLSRWAFAIRDEWKDGCALTDVSGAEAFTKPLGRPRKKHTVQSELQRLRMENALLKKFHTELRKVGREAQYRVIHRLREEYPVQAMCIFFELSRAEYYAWVRRIDRADQDRDRIALIQQAYQRSHRNYGYRRIADWVQREHGQVINHKAVLRLMQKLSLRSIARRRKVAQGVENSPHYHQYANLLARDFTATRPNQKWVTDVTRIQTQQGTVYLSVIKDLCDGFIAAHATSSQNSVELVTTTLKRALRNQPDMTWLG